MRTCQTCGRAYDYKRELVTGTAENLCPSCREKGTLEDWEEILRRRGDLGDDEEFPPFEPRPDFELSAELRDAFPSWVNESALCRLLSALPEEQWDPLLSVLRLDDSQYYSVQLQPTGHPEWDQAYWDLYKDIRATRGLGDDFPFPLRDQGGQQQDS